MRLAPLLKTLRAHGVAEYSGGGVTVRFGGDGPPEVRERKELKPKEAEPARDAMELAIELSQGGSYNDN